MYNTKRGFGITTVLAAAIFAASLSVAFAGPPTDDISFIGVGGDGISGPPDSQAYDLTWYDGSGEETEDAYTGDYGLTINGGPVQNVFCTSLDDNTFIPESWTAEQVQTSASGYASVPSTAYASPVVDEHEGYAVGPNNISAIDFITQHYASFTYAGLTGDPTEESNINADAQLAIWDLVNGGHVVDNSGTYNWAGLDNGDQAFSAAGVTQANMEEIYDIEQDALNAGSGPFGSQWLLAEYGTQIPTSDSSPPQDFTFSTGTDFTPPPPAPEPASFAVFGFVGFGILALALRRRMRPAQAPTA